MIRKLTSLSIAIIVAALAATPLAVRSQDRTVVTQRVTQQLVKSSFHGSPLPELVSLDGGAVAPADALGECDPGELAIARTATDLVTKLVQAENGGRKWIAGNALTSVTESQLGLSATEVPSPNGSYVVQLALFNPPVDTFMKALAAFGDCLSVRFGHADRAAQLGLLPLPPQTLIMAQYAPTVGFYLITRSSRR
jgi:hypothetical protein